jgi:hypothetical protein
MLITALAGLVVVVGQYFFFAQQHHWLTTFNQWYQIATTVAYPIGLVSLFAVHAKNIQRKRARWPLSLMLIVVTSIYLVVALITGPAAGTAMDWVFQSYIAPAGATLYGIIAFIITSCAFRVFRFRSREATVLIITAIFILIAQSPLGGLLWSQWAPIGNWILTVPNNAAFRAITLGAYLGGFATAIRVLLGIERSHIGGVAK